MRFSFKSIDRHLLGGVVVVWIGGVALAAGALTAFVDANRLHDEVQTDATVISRAKIERIVTPVSPADLAAIAKQLGGAHPAVKVDVQGGNLRLSIKSAQGYSEFRAAIADMMQSGASDFTYETVTICGANCDTTYFVAEFAVKRGRYEVT